MTEIVPYTRRPGPEVGLAERAPALEVAARFADVVAGTEFVPNTLRDRPAAIAAAILYGDEVGLGPMQSLAKITVINGVPTLRAEAQRALILRHGHDIWPEEMTTARATVAGRRRDSDQTVRVTWTMDDAKRAGLSGKPPWRQYPRAMLFARASAELARAEFADAIGGLAATEELDDEGGYFLPANGAAPPPEQPTPKPTRRRRAPARSSSSSPPRDPEPPEEPEPPAPDPDPAPRPTPGRGSTEGATPDPEPPSSSATATAAPPTSSALIDDRQRRHMMALYREKGIEGRAERLNYAQAVVGRELGSSNELTEAEADQVIGSLGQYDRDDPQTWPFPEGF